MGHSVPDFELLDGTLVGEHLRDGHGLLLEFDVDTLLSAAANRWSDRIARVVGKGMDAPGLKAVLVRPDGVVAWAGEAVADAEAFAQAATRWFGEPSVFESVR